MKVGVLLTCVSFLVFAFVMSAQPVQTAHVPGGCPAGWSGSSCCYKHWCSNAPCTWGVCGCTCTTAGCQDGNPLTLNSCATTYCTSTSCPSNRADVNNNPSDGCEVNLIDNPNHCGSVGNVCPSGVCSGGVCTNFNIAIDPASGLANRGDSKLVNVTVTPVLASVGVSFSATGLPPGTTASFSPASCNPSCHSNATITVGASTPIGSHILSIRGTTGSLVKTVSYNLTVLPTSCNNNAVCSYPETQSSCPSDCSTVASMTSPVTPGQIATVTVEFHDSRYRAGDRVKIDMLIDGTLPWTPANGCQYGGVKMGPSAGNGAIQWPSGTVSENGHFQMSVLCTVPSTISAGPHTLVATPTIY